MRTVGVVLVLLLVGLLPNASAEWGSYGADGRPLNVDGESTNPYPDTILLPPSGPLN